MALMISRRNIRGTIKTGMMVQRLWQSSFFWRGGDATDGDHHNNNVHDKHGRDEEEDR